MKKLLYAILPILLACISCSDDDLPKNSDGITKVYRGKSLEMTLNDSILPGRSVLLSTSDFVTSDLTLYKAIPGEDEILFKGVKLDKSEDSYKFNNIESNYDGYTIAISGELSADNVLRIDIKHQITSETFTAVPRWKLEGNILKGGIWWEIVPNSPTDSVDLKGFWGRNKMPVVAASSKDDDMQSLLRSISGMLPMIVKLYVEANNDGKIAFEWEPGAAASMLPFEFKAGKTDPGLLNYNLKEDSILHMKVAIDKMLSALSIEDLIKQISSGAIGGDASLNQQDLTALIGLAQKIYTGLPLETKFYTEGTGTRAKRKMELVIDRETLLPYAETLPKLLVPLVKDIDAGEIGTSMGITGEGLAAFLEETFRVVKESKEFKIKLKFSE